MKEQRITLVKIACAVFFVLFAFNAFAGPMIGADLVMKSKYIWRGMPSNDEAVFWPDAWISYQGFTFTWFGSMEMTDIYDNKNKFTEIDYYLDYSRSFGRWNTSIGYAHYEYPNTSYLITGELYAAVSTDCKFFSPSLTVYYDIREAKGLYIMPSISHTCTNDKIPVTPTITVSMGYADKKHNEYYSWVDKAGILDLTANLALSWTPPGTLGNYMAVSGDLNYAKIISGDLADAWPDGDSNFFWGLGINLFTELGGGE